MADELEFYIGDRAKADGRDYEFEGIVVTKFTKRRGGGLRYVMEDDRGLLMIFSARTMTIIERG